MKFLASVAAIFDSNDLVILKKSDDDALWTAVAKYPQREGGPLSRHAKELLIVSERAKKQGSPAEITLLNRDGLVLRAVPLISEPARNVVSHTSVDISGILAFVYHPDAVAKNVLQSATETLLAAVAEANFSKSAGPGKGAEPLLLDQVKQRKIMRDLFAEKQFIKQVYLFCNSLTVELGVERVSLGVIKGSKIVLRGVSQSAHFDHRSALARDIAETMEEACDQGQPVGYPWDRDGRLVTRNHRQFTESHGNRAVLSIPLIGANEPFGALFIERSADQLEPAEVAQLDDLARSIAPYLERSYAADRFALVKAAKAFVRGAKFLFGPRRVGEKLLITGMLVAIAFISVVKIEHRVDARAILRSTDVAVVSAPFDGFLAAVHTDLGETVLQDQLLAELDTRELLQEESIAVADVARYAREVEKARAVREFAAMNIAASQQAQAEANLELVRFRLANAEIRALRNGIIVEGDLRKQLGSPIRQGDFLMQIASNEELYLELEFDQTSFHLIDRNDIGELALVGRPDQKIEFAIERIDPIARSGPSGNSFEAKAGLTSERQAWWRPGMVGTAKIEAGEKTILWIVSHRTINFLREFFWL